MDKGEKKSRSKTHRSGKRKHAKNELGEFTPLLSPKKESDTGFSQELDEFTPSYQRGNPSKGNSSSTSASEEEDSFEELGSPAPGVSIADVIVTPVKKKGKGKRRKSKTKANANTHIDSSLISAKPVYIYLPLFLQVTDWKRLPKHLYDKSASMQIPAQHQLTNFLDQDTQKMLTVVGQFKISLTEQYNSICQAHFSSDEFYSPRLLTFLLTHLFKEFLLTQAKKMDFSNDTTFLPCTLAGMDFFDRSSFSANGEEEKIPYIKFTLVGPEGQEEQVLELNVFYQRLKNLHEFYKTKQHEISILEQEETLSWQQQELTSIDMFNALSSEYGLRDREKNLRNPEKPTKILKRRKFEPVIDLKLETLRKQYIALIQEYIEKRTPPKDKLTIQKIKKANLYINKLNSTLELHSFLDLVDPANLKGQIIHYYTDRFCGIPLGQATLYKDLYALSKSYQATFTSLKTLAKYPQVSAASVKEKKELIEQAEKTFQDIDETIKSVKADTAFRIETLTNISTLIHDLKTTQTKLESILSAIFIGQPDLAQLDLLINDYAQNFAAVQENMKTFSAKKLSLEKTLKDLFDCLARSVTLGSEKNSQRKAGLQESIRLLEQQFTESEIAFTKLDKVFNSLPSPKINEKLKAAIVDNYKAYREKEKIEQTIIATQQLIEKGRSQIEEPRTILEFKNQLQNFLPDNLKLTSTSFELLSTLGDECMQEIAIYQENTDIYSSSIEKITQEIEAYQQMRLAAKRSEDELKKKMATQDVEKYQLWGNKGENYSNLIKSLPKEILFDPLTAAKEGYQQQLDYISSQFTCSQAYQHWLENRVSYKDALSSFLTQTDIQRQNIKDINTALDQYWKQAVEQVTQFRSNNPEIVAKAAQNLQVLHKRYKNSSTQLETFQPLSFDQKLSEQFNKNNSECNHNVKKYLDAHTKKYKGENPLPLTFENIMKSSTTFDAELGRKQSGIKNSLHYIDKALDNRTQLEKRGILLTRLTKITTLLKRKQQLVAKYQDVAIKLAKLPKFILENAQLIGFETNNIYAEVESLMNNQDSSTKESINTDTRPEILLLLIDLINLPAEVDQAAITKLFKEKPYLVDEQTELNTATGQIQYLLNHPQTYISLYHYVDNIIKLIQEIKEGIIHLSTEEQNFLNEFSSTKELRPKNYLEQLLKEYPAHHIVDSNRRVLEDITRYLNKLDGQLKDYQIPEFPVFKGELDLDSALNISKKIQLLLLNKDVKRKNIKLINNALSQLAPEVSEVFYSQLLQQISHQDDCYRGQMGIIQKKPLFYKKKLTAKIHQLFEAMAVSTPEQTPTEMEEWQIDFDIFLRPIERINLSAFQPLWNQGERKINHTIRTHLQLVLKLFTLPIPDACFFDTKTRTIWIGEIRQKAFSCLYRIKLLFQSKYSGSPLTDQIMDHFRDYLLNRVESLFSHWENNKKEILFQLYLLRPLITRTNEEQDRRYNDMVKDFEMKTTKGSMFKAAMLTPDVFKPLKKAYQLPKTSLPYSPSTPVPGTPHRLSARAASAASPSKFSASSSITFKRSHSSADTQTPPMSPVQTLKTGDEVSAFRERTLN